MYLTNFRFQNKILTGTGIKPTVPSPSTATPDSVTWDDATDIMVGEIAYNRTDDIWYYRQANQIKILKASYINYFGDPDTNGTWRILMVGVDLVFQVRVSGIYETRQTITA